MTATLPIDQIRLDGGTRLRAEHKSEIVAEYVEALRAGVKFPPVVVFFDGTNHWLADGFYRVEAHQAAGIAEVVAEVRDGSRRDAILHAAAANESHGARRTAADRRRAVQALLSDREWSNWSDVEIARQCGVGATTVRRLRAELSSPMAKIAQATEPPTENTAVATNSTTKSTREPDPIEASEPPVDATPPVRKAVRGGTIYELDVAKIGKGKTSFTRMSPKAAKMLDSAAVKLDSKERDALRRMAPLMQQWVARRLRDGESKTVAEAKQAIVGGAPTGPWDRAQEAVMALQPADRLHLCKQVLTAVAGEDEARQHFADHICNVMNWLPLDEQQRLLERLERTVQARRSLHVVREVR